MCPWSDRNVLECMWKFWSENISSRRNFSIKRVARTQTNIKSLSQINDKSPRLWPPYHLGLINMSLGWKLRILKHPPYKKTVNNKKKMEIYHESSASDRKTSKLIDLDTLPRVVNGGCGLLPVSSGGSRFVSSIDLIGHSLRINFH